MSFSWYSVGENSNSNINAGLLVRVSCRKIYMPIRCETRTTRAVNNLYVYTNKILPQVKFKPNAFKKKV
jgi:hypothetical protein